MSKKKVSEYQDGPSETIEPDGPIVLQGPEADATPVFPPTPMKDYIVRFTGPHGDPVAYTVRCSTVEDARATFSITITEHQPGPPPAPKPPKRFVRVEAAKTAERQARSLEVPVHAADELEAIRLAKEKCYSDFRFEAGSITSAVCGETRWSKAPVTKEFTGE